MAQATGTPAHKKYQTDGGPGIADIMSILRGSVDATTDLRNFFKAQLVFWLLAATDGHAKNFSVAHLPDNQFRATPLYDVLSAYPIIGPGAKQIPIQKAKLAMGVRGSTIHYLTDKIHRRHWLSQAKQIGLDTSIVNDIMQELIELTPQVIEQTAQHLPSSFPSAIAQAIFTGLQRQADKLAAMPELCSKRTKSEARKIAGFVHLMRGRNPSKSVRPLQSRRAPFLASQAAGVKWTAAAAPATL